MIGKILKLKTTLISIAIAFVIGSGVGAWTLYKFYSMAEADRLESYIKDQKISHEKTIKNIEELHEKKLKIASDNVKIERIIEYVEDNRACDLNNDTEQLLNLARTGMPTTPSRINEGGQTITPITQGQQIESCSKDGIQYRELHALYESLKQWIRDNRR